MKATVAASMRQGNHGPQARSICKKISPQHAQTGKHEYFLKAEIHGRSKPWEFFTDDQSGPVLPARWRHADDHDSALQELLRWERRPVHPGVEESEIAQTTTPYDP